MNRKPQWLACVSIISLLLGMCLSFMPRTAHAATPGFSSTHFFGGFNITTSQMGQAAANDGISETHRYGKPAAMSSPLGQTLQSRNMHEMDSYIWTLLYEYECHRSKTAEPPGWPAYCIEDYPFMTDSSVLLSYVNAHLQHAKGNNLIDAYWVLDDWPLWDVGSAQPLLQQIHSLIQQYTPGRPAVCGFGAEFGYNHDDYWYDQLADNFSPQGCDAVGLYVYSTAVAPTVSPPPSSDAFDWSMSTVLPKMFASLSARGWNNTQEPFVGIGQAFAGTYTNGYYSIKPSAQNMATQALSFCQHGAIGMFWYAWNTGSVLTKPKTPMNNSSIEQGVKQGVAACTSYWRG